MIRVLGTILAALLGLAFGSFLNVCLSRWPAGESIVTPRSHCRNCGRTLAWWDNIPLVSWIALHGRCRNCGAWIGWRYVIVETALAALWAFEASRSLPSAISPAPPIEIIFYQASAGALTMLLIWLLVGLAVLDAEHLWLPDWLTLPGIALGFISASLHVFLAMPFFAANLLYRSLSWIGGVLAAAVLILVIRWLYWLIRRREGLGLGDAKLMALLAAWLGFSGALLAFGIGVVLGALVSLVLLLVARRQPGERWGLLKLPLGTFLCIGGIVSALWGQAIIATYLLWAGF